MNTYAVRPVFKAFGQGRKEMTSEGLQLAPHYNIQPIGVGGVTWYLVRLNGQIITSIPAQTSRKAARLEAVRHFWHMRGWRQRGCPDEPTEAF